MIKKLSYLVFVIFLFLGLPSFVSAYEYSTFVTEANGDFIVGPAKSEIVLAPGETKTQRITIKSRIDGEQKFRIFARDFVGSDNPEEIVRFIEDGSGISPYPLSEYISVELNEFSLDLGETLTFDVTISVPKDAEPGGRYGAIVISATPEVTAEGGVGVQFYSEIGALLLVRIDGEVDEFGFVEDFTLNDKKGGVFFKKPLLLKTFFRNAGNVHLIPYGQIVISNMFGREVGVIPIDAYFALPDAVRLRSFSWPDKQDKSFLIGRYTAELQMYPGYRDIPEIVQLRFWYLPIYAILIFVGVIFLVMVIRAYFLKNYRRVNNN